MRGLFVCTCPSFSTISRECYNMRIAVIILCHSYAKQEEKIDDQNVKCTYNICLGKCALVFI